MSLVTGEVLLTVRAGEVERGDRIGGFPAYIVERIVFDGSLGRWFYGDRFGTPICSRHWTASVQVWRGGLSADDTPPHGIDRPLVVAS